MSVIKFQFEEDIRRVFVDNIPSYSEISDLIKKLYKDLANKSFTLAYVDTDEDVVTVTSDEELEEAFRNFTTPVARFTINLTEQGTLLPPFQLTIIEEEPEDDDNSNPFAELIFRHLLASQTSPFLRSPQRPTTCGPCQSQRTCAPQPPAHFADCDHCGERIVGFRFKCGTCDDFDLCQKCFPSKNEKHAPEHLFMRIARPLPPFFRFARTEEKSLAEKPKTDASQETVPIPAEVPVEAQVEKKEESKPVEEPVQENVEVAPVQVETPVEAEKPEEKSTERQISPFEAKLNQLEEMGFNDKSRNIFTLVHRKGDLVQAIRDLLDN
jgi:hypothetical protein